MRCLWITRQDPRSSDSGELIHSLGLIRSLADQPGIELTVLAHYGNKADDPGIPATWELHGRIPEGRVRGIFSALPSDSYRLGNPVMRDALRGLLAGDSWDWIAIDQAACAWALDLIPSGRKIAYIAHNHEAPLRRQVAADPSGSLPMRLVLRWDSIKYAALEKKLCKRSALISAITPRDADAFQSLCPGTPVIVLSPGYQWTIPDSPPPVREDSPRRVVLAGTFEWLAKRRNLESFLAVSEKPFRDASIEFLIVGKTIPGFYEQLAKRFPWARFHANVPSMAPFLAGARIGLIPEALGGGFKLKALDYIFSGLPLAAIEAALSGIPFDPRTDAISAPDQAALAVAVAERIDDVAFLNAAAQRAFDACRGAFDWADRGKTLAAALRSNAVSLP